MFAPRTRAANWSTALLSHVRALPGDRQFRLRTDTLRRQFRDDLLALPKEADSLAKQLTEPLH